MPGDAVARAGAAHELTTCPFADVVTLSLDAVICRHIARVLDACHGNQSQAAHVLGIDRKTVWRYRQRLRSPAPT